MRWLCRLGYLSLLVMVVLACIMLPLYYARIGKVQQEASAIQAIRDLLMSITDATEEARTLQKIVRMNLTTPFSTERFDNVVAEASDAFSRYSVLRQNMNIYGAPPEPSVTYWSVGSAAIFKPTNVSLSAAIVQFETACSNLKNVTPSDLNFTLELEMLQSPLTQV